jgi:exodeoxyribonuclease V
MIWSPQQSRALPAVSHWLKHWKTLGKPFFTLAGYAGTGKTTLARELTSGVSGEVFYASYTGKAAHVLRRTGLENASTIHKLIYLPKFKCVQKLVDLQAKRALLARSDGKEAELAAVELSIAREQDNLKRLDFTLNQDSPLWRAALVVIDEYSMVDEQTGADLLSFGCPVLALGDPGQLPPVQGTRFFRDKPDVLLTEIHRQAADNPIIRMSRDVREGRALLPGQYGESRVVRRSRISDQELAPLVRDADQLLVGLNETRHQFNKYARTILGRADHRPVVGDKLVCLRNNLKEGLLNGQTWHVHSVSGEEYLRLRLRGEDGELVSCVAHPEHFAGSANHIDPRTRLNANEFDYGYAMTVHKGQGSQWDSVVLLDEWRSSNRRQWLYTGITRASKRITIVQ